MNLQNHYQDLCDFGCDDTIRSSKIDIDIQDGKFKCGLAIRLKMMAMWVGTLHVQNVKSACNFNVATSNPGIGVHLT